MMTDTMAGASRESARLMLMMRRLIREEFSVTVHLDEAEATEELLAFAGRSRNALLQGLAGELEQLLVPPAPTPAAGAPAGRVYRGALQPTPPRPGRETPAATTTKRIYRNRVVG